MNAPPSADQLAPERQIAPYTTIKQIDATTVQLRSNDQTVTLSQEALSLLIAYIERAEIDYNPEGLWPGIEL